MARYRLAAIAQLAHQLKLSPVRLRPRQITGAEHLLDLIEANKAYPADFVCFHITGYRPKRSTSSASLHGKHLVGDLVQLVEDLSLTPVLDATAVPEPVWSTEQLAARLNVSTKTICRWRRRGLAGRRLRFADGGVRVAFLDRCVRRFVYRNAAMVMRGAAFRQLTPAEKRHIVERARALLHERRIRLHELSQRIAAETHRAVETVRYTLRRYDREHPEEALFGNNEQPVVRPEHEALYEAYKSGGSMVSLAARFGQSVTATEQIIREIRARELLARPLEYVFSHEFDAPDAEERILHDDNDGAGDTNRLPRSEEPLLAASVAPRDLPPYLRDLYREPLLTASQEQALFRRYNYLKFKAARLRRRLDPLHCTEQEVRAIEQTIVAAEVTKDRITRANLRLVVSIARRHVGRSPEFLEIVSDGNMSLMRAIEKFDYTRGYKFSTYASWAIMRNYARTIPETLYHANRHVTGSDELLDTVPDNHEPPRDAIDAEMMRRTLDRGLATLTDREREIVTRHFGLAKDTQPETLDQIGRGFGLTKERIRQIERGAIRRLREVLIEQGSAAAVAPE